MSLKITDKCINCGVCEMECPYEAVFPAGMNWRKIQNKYFRFCADNSAYDEFFSLKHYYIVPDKCTECKGMYDLPKCQEICPIKCCIADKEHWESEEHLYAKKMYLETMPGWR